ncbi:MAG: hypothetical protein FJX47_10195 [Alphaproteobacteria bacterium]|nr:hypothetical protein [Alphaproteobacteria bacterium]
MPGQRNPGRHPAQGPEFAGLRRARLRRLAGMALCCGADPAESGFSQSVAQGSHKDRGVSIFDSLDTCLRRQEGDGERRLKPS